MPTSDDAIGMSESPVQRKARKLAELAALEAGEVTPPAHGVHVGPDPWGTAPKGAEVDMPEVGKPVERSRHRSPVTAAIGPLGEHH